MSDWTGNGSTTGLTEPEGPYCGVDDIRAQLPLDVLIQLTDDDNTGGMDVTRVTQAIETADAEIDGYCAGRYTVPFSPVPPVIRALSVEIAVYYLYKRRTVPDRIEKAYDKAIARLKDISRGLLTLGVIPDPISAPATESGVRVTATPRMFTRNRLKGF